MAAIESMRFIPFIPPSNAEFCNRNTLRTATVSPSLPSLASSKKIPRSTTVHSHSSRQPEEERNAAARDKCWEQALDYSNDDFDDDLPSLEELLQIPRRQKSLGKASRTEPIPQHLQQQALNQAGVQVKRARSGIAERQGDSPEQPMVLDDDDSEEPSTEDEAEGGSDDIETERTERDTSLHGTLGSLEFASEPTMVINTSGSWCDVKEGRYIDELSTLTEPAPRSPTPLLNGDDGWTDDSMAELEKAVELALVEEVNSLSTSTPSSPRLFAADLPQEKIETRPRTETSGSRPEGLRDAFRYGSPNQGLEVWEQQDTQVEDESQAKRELQEEGLVREGGQVDMRQQEDIRADSHIHPSSEAPPEVDPKHLAAAINSGHRLLRSASPSCASSPVLCDKTDLENAGEKRGRKDTHTVSSESQYSVNSDDTCNDKGPRPTKRRKPCAAPALITPLHAQGSQLSVPPLIAASLEIDNTQPEADEKYSSKLVDKEQQYASHSSRNSSMTIEDCLSREDEELDEVAMDDYSQQGNDTDSSDNSADESYRRDTSDDEDEEFRPAKRSKLLSRPRRRHRFFCIPAESGNVRSKHSCHPLSKANKQLCSPPISQNPSPSAESIPLAKYQEHAVNGVFKYTRIGNDTTFNLELQVAGLPEHFELTAPLKAMSSTLAAKISSQPQISSRCHASSTHYCKTQPPRKHIESSARPHTTQHPVTSSGSEAHHKEALPRRRIQWTEEEEDTVVNMRIRRASWKEISVAVPSHPLGSITGHYYGNLCKRT